MSTIYNELYDSYWQLLSAAVWKWLVDSYGDVVVLVNDVGLIAAASKDSSYKNPER